MLKTAMKQSPSRVRFQLFMPRILILAGLGLVLASCAGTGADAGPAPAADLNGVLGLDDALAELSALPTPEEMDPDRFAGLKRNLSEMLTATGLSRFSAAAPTSAGSTVDDLRIWDSGDGTARCLWTYANEGDYNQDSQVTANDITPLGQYYEAADTDADWPRACIADGNSDGFVAVTDITPIGQYFGVAVDGYVIETSALPQSVGAWSEVALVPFEAGMVPAVGGRRRFVYDLPAPVADNYYRVVPVQDGSPGVSSELFQYTGDPEPAFTVEGICIDPAGTPIPGVVVSLGDQPEITTGPEGTFIFTDVADGLIAEMTAELDGYVFNPPSWVIAVENATVYGKYFTGSMLDALATNLPAEGFVDQNIGFELRAVDSNGTTVAGYSSEGYLVATPGNLDLGTVQFSDGLAHTSVRFSATGNYTVSVDGLGSPLDGTIGTIEITNAQIPEMSVTKWQGDAEAAISLTFDDGTPDLWSRGLPLWDEYGFRVTLGILKRNFTDAPARIPQLQQAFDAGHEIANHTATHQDLTTITEAAVQVEIDDCETFLIENINGLNRIDTFVYPYEQFNDNVISLLEGRGYMFARSGYQGISDYAQLNDSWSPPFMHLYSWANQAELPLWMWDSTTDWAVSHGDWLIEQCHGIGVLGEEGVGWSPRPESEYRAHYDHLKSFGDQLWIAPIREVGCYLIERNNAQFEVLEFTGNRLDFLIYDALDNEVFDIPLTIRLDLPSGWDAVRVQQGLSDLVVETHEGYVLFNAAPGSGMISVHQE